MDLEVCVDNKVCASLDLEDQAVLSPRKTSEMLRGACWSWGCRAQASHPWPGRRPASRLVLERRVAPSADRVSRQGRPSPGKGDGPRSGLEMCVKPNSNQMRLTRFQRPPAIPGLARRRPRPGQPGLFVP